TACLWRSSISEVATDVAGVELDRVNIRVHIKPRRVRCLVYDVRVRGSTDAAIVPDCQNARRSGHESKSVLVHVDRMWAPAGITTGGIVPDSSGTRCKPDLERVKENAVGVVGIHGHTLVVPILGIVTLAIVTVSERAALGTLHESPGCTAVGGSPSADLAAIGAAATAVAIGDNGLHLSIDVIRVTRRDSNIYSAQLIAGINVNKRRAAPGIHVRTSRIRAAG